jgi:putative nucleotidyltransferase with HDIG domain
MRKEEDDTITVDITDELEHAMIVSNMAYDVGKELKLDEDVCYELALAGMLHDIGKLKLAAYVYGNEDPLVIEKMKYERMHSKLGYDALKDKGYSRFILDAILYHHENNDGSGYPCNLREEEIPLGARILHVCDVYAAFLSDRPYREAFDVASSMELMIEESKNFDMEIFLAFQRVVHK